MDGKLCPLDESGGKGEGLHSSLDELECVRVGCLAGIVKEVGCSLVGCSSSTDSDDWGCFREGR